MNIYILYFFTANPYIDKQIFYTGSVLEATTINIVMKIV